MQVERISPRALQQARQCGFDGNEADVLAALRELVRYSAPLRHRAANRRNGRYLLRVDGGTLQHVLYVACETCLDRKQVPMYEPCAACRCSGRDVDQCPARRVIALPCPDCFSNATRNHRAPYAAPRSDP